MKWQEHKDRILAEIAAWSLHPRAPDTSSRAAVATALNDAELAIFEAQKAEEEVEYMDKS